MEWREVHDLLRTASSNPALRADAPEGLPQPDLLRWRAALCWTSVTLPEGLYVGPHPKEAWRSFVWTECLDCDWSRVVRNWQSKRAQNRKAINAAAARHRVENSGHIVRVGYGHG